MNPVVYWRATLGLFWAFTFFALLSLVIAMTYFKLLSFYQYAIFFSAILVALLAAFMLFNRKHKAGLFACLILSGLFVFNQLLTLYYLVLFPKMVLPLEASLWLFGMQQDTFAAVVSLLFLAWGALLFIAAWKSKPVFESKKMHEHLRWLSALQKQSKSIVKPLEPPEAMP